MPIRSMSSRSISVRDYPRVSLGPPGSMDQRRTGGLCCVKESTAVA
jgi:hypothetical protein